MIPRFVATLILAIAAAIAIASCARAPATSESNDAEFKVALLTPGPVSDAGWNASAYEGLKSIESNLGAKTAMVQTASPADFEDAFRDFASRGFKLVFGHGFEYTDTALKVAKLFPATTFVITSGSGSSDNVASVTFKIEEAAYVLGVLAGSASKTGVTGAVGGIELPAIRLTFDGYRRGYLSARPDGKVLTSFIGSFEDVGAAKEAALAQISRGADFLFHNADAAGLGVFQAAAQSKIFAFGSNRNQNDVVPDAVLASAVTNIPGAFLRIATEVKAGTFKPAMIEYGMRDAMVSVVYNDKLTAKIEPTSLERANAATRDITEGRVTFPPMPRGN